MKVLLIAFLLLGCSSAFGACVVAVTSPNGSANVAGYSFNLTATNTGCNTPVYTEEFLIDGERAGIKIISPTDAVTTLNWNTYNVDNGNHSAQVIARDLFGNTLATSTTVAFSVWNFLPQNTCAYSDPPTSACSGLTVTTGPSTFFPLGAQTFALSTISFKSSSGSVVQSASAGVGASSVTLNGVVQGHVIAVYVFWLSASSSLTVTDGSSYTCPSGTRQAFNSSESIQWCYLPNAGAGTHTVSVSTGAGQIRGIQAKELAGVPTSNGVDIVHTVAGNSGQSQFDGPFALSQTDEIVLGGISYVGAPSITSAPGYVSVVQDPDVQTTTEALLTSGNNWSGVWAISYTVTGSKATQTKTVTLAIDGYKVADNDAAMVGPLPASTSATGTVLLPTARFLSAVPHTVVLEARNTDGSSGIGSLGFWGSFGGWEVQATFSNPLTPMELRSSARDQVILCSSFPCSNTVALTATVVNSDGSNTPATISSCASSNTSVFAKISSCTVQPQGYGSAFMTLTDSNGFTRRAWIYVRATNTLPHFGMGGQRLNAYSAGNSILFHDIFLTSFSRLSPAFPYLNGDGTLSGQIGAANTMWGIQFANAYRAAGYQAIEFTPPGTASTDTQSTFQTRIDNYVTNVCGALDGLKAFALMGPGYFADSADLDPAYFSFYSPASTFTTPPMQYVTEKLTAGCGFAMEGPDEISSIYKTNPWPTGTATGIAMGTNGLTNVVCSGNTCTVNWTNYSLNGGNGGMGTFLMSGTGQGALDYPSSELGKALFSPTPIDSNTFSFTPFIPLTATITSGALEPFSYNTFNSAGQHCDNGMSSNCIGWVHANLFGLAQSQIGAVTNHIGIAYPPSAAGNQNNSQQAMNWCQANVAEFCDIYPPSAISENYLPLYNALSTLNGDGGAGDQIRTLYGYIPEATPLITLVGTLTTNYTFHGYPVPIASMSGNIITFSQDHGRRNVFPGITRLSVCAAPPCNGTAGTVAYYVESWPTSTTAKVVLANDDGTCNPACSNGTLQFDDGSTWSLTGGGLITGGGGNVAARFLTTDSCSHNIRNKRGQGFHITGSSPDISGINWIFEIETLDTCPFAGNDQQVARQVPVLSCSSSCGVAYIVADNQIRVGGGSYRPAQENGPREGFAQSMYYFSANKSSGSRQYGPGGASLQIYDRTGVGGGVQTGFSTATHFSRLIFQDVSLQRVQPGNDPVFNDGRSFQEWESAAVGNLMQNRLAQYALQPQLPSPDCGRFFECSARQDVNGNTLLMVQSLADWPLTFTSTLTPYLIAGQGIVRECADWHDVAPVTTLPAGTNIDPYIYPPGGFCAYIFDHAASSVAAQPTISVRLADIDGAAGWAIEWTQGPPLGNGVPYPFSDQTDIIPQIVDCGSASSCTIPADRTFGPISWRLVFYDVNKKPLTLQGAFSTL